MGLPAEDDIVTTDKTPSITPASETAPEGAATPTPEEPHVPMGENVDITIGAPESGSEETATDEDEEADISISFGEHSITVKQEDADKQFEELINSLKSRHAANTGRCNELSKEYTDALAAVAAGDESQQVVAETALAHMQTLAPTVLALGSIIAILDTPCILVPPMTKEVHENFEEALSRLMGLIDTQEPGDPTRPALLTIYSVGGAFVDTFEEAAAAGVYDDQLCGCCQDHLHGESPAEGEAQEEATAAEAEAPTETEASDEGAEGDTTAEGSGEQ